MLYSHQPFKIEAIVFKAALKTQHHPIHKRPIFTILTLVLFKALKTPEKNIWLLRLNASVCSPGSC